MHSRTEGRRVPLVEVVVSDGLDVTAVPRLAQLLDEALSMQPDLLVVDLARCPAIDAAGIGLLLHVHRLASRAGSRLTLRSPSPRLRRNLRLAYADGVLDVTPRDGEA